MKAPATILIVCAVTAGCATMANLSEQELRAQSDTDLCDAYAVHGDARAYEEVRRRELLTDDEWKAAPYKKIVLGMSGLAVTCAWGQPSHINRTVHSFGEREQWVYCPKGPWGIRERYPCIGSSDYVYFEDGVVIGWQN